MLLRQKPLGNIERYSSTGGTRIVKVPVSEDDFNAIDADNDGEITVDEVINDEGNGNILLLNCDFYYS